MGDAEKKSSAESGKAQTGSAGTGLQLHCFPDIAATAKKARRSACSDEELFQRVVPGSDNCFCAPFGAGANVEVVGKAPSIEEAEQIGYQRGFCEGERKGRTEGEAAGLEKGRQAVQPVIQGQVALVCSVHKYSGR